MMLDFLDAHDVGYAEPDRFAGAPHPREMLSLIGHAAAEVEFLDAYRSGRLPHAWLIGGEEGIGKATLAYRIARFVLAHPQATSAAVRAARDLSVPRDAPGVKQIGALAHPDLAVIRRGLTKDRKSVMTETSVDEVRRGLEVFTKTAGAGGYRIVIVDACEDLNASSANALLKTLEEPPAQSLLLLVTHQPRRVLPTIRSRCRLLALRPLEPQDIVAVTQGMAVFGDLPEAVHRRAAELAEGSARRALSVLDPKRLAFNDRVEAVLTALPRMDGGEIDAIAEQTHGRPGEESFGRFCELCESWLLRELAERPRDVASLSPLPELWAKLTEARQDIDSYNLDRRPFVIAMLSDLAAAARRHYT